MSDEIVDLAFAVSGRSAAMDYAGRLWRALSACLPWLAEDSVIGVHPLTGVSRGEAELYLSRRTRLILRLPRDRVADAEILSGQTLDLGGEVRIGAATTRPLTAAKVLYSPFVTMGTADESVFFERCREELAARGINAGLICGKARRATAADGEWQGFSLMLHGLGAEDSLRVQREGLGGERKRGCGIFVPHKAIAAVGE